MTLHDHVMNNPYYFIDLSSNSCAYQLGRGHCLLVTLLLDKPLVT